MNIAGTVLLCTLFFAAGAASGFFIGHLGRIKIPEKSVHSGPGSGKKQNDYYKKFLDYDGDCRY